MKDEMSLLLQGIIVRSADNLKITFICQGSRQKVIGSICRLTTVVQMNVIFQGKLLFLTSSAKMDSYMCCTRWI
uniref:Ubiquitin-like domain-containing CTD phosphatase n=1 Tax=Rhizophora mucronata TaxID=61149 RepID=A0A2P2NMD7_RHIMU